MVILLYREERLEKYLKMPQVQKLLREAGYESDRLEDILPVFCDRYETYAEREPFPHELGLLLGYPPEDVEGFIRHQGKNSLCTGYWKVYADKEGKQRLFEKYEYAKGKFDPAVALWIKDDRNHKYLRMYRSIETGTERCGKGRKNKWIRFM